MGADLKHGVQAAIEATDRAYNNGAPVSRLSHVATANS